MKEFVALRPKTYSYLIDVKRRLKFNDHKDCLLNNKIILKSQQRFKSKKHNAGFELTYRDSGNRIHFKIFTMSLSHGIRKITITNNIYFFISTVEVF